MFGASVGNLFKLHDKLRDKSGDASDGKSEAKSSCDGAVREGATYRHSGPGELTETAEVLHVGPDAMGITHVRYRVRVKSARERRAKFEDSRTLNIETFTNYFSETVEA